ncbi:MAG: phosphate signaling complex protein PhoU [Bacteroidales bacterium]
MIEEKINFLKQELISYAGLVENMIRKSINALKDKDDELAKSVIEKDECRANDLEIEIDELCTNIIAQYSPKGRDLRKVLMMLKMNNDLERIGDHAVNIAQSVIRLNEPAAYTKIVDVTEMSTMVLKMLNESIDAFINDNSVVAKNVCSYDSEVDKIRDINFTTILEHMKSGTISIDRALHLRRIFSNLERIADLATNICEEVIFIVEGKVIKHHKDL